MIPAGIFAPVRVPAEFDAGPARLNFYLLALGGSSRHVVDFLGTGAIFLWVFVSRGGRQVRAHRQGVRVRMETWGRHRARMHTRRECRWRWGADPGRNATAQRQPCRSERPGATREKAGSLTEAVEVLVVRSSRVGLQCAAASFVRQQYVPRIWGAGDCVLSAL